MSNFGALNLEMLEAAEKDGVEEVSIWGCPYRIGGNMDAGSDNTKVEIEHLPFDDKGEKLEPEQQIAKQVTASSAPVSLGGNETGQQIPLSIEQYMTAGVMAATVRDQCGSCKFFDRTAWRAQLRHLMSTHEGRGQLNAIFAMLLNTQNISFQELHTGLDGDFDTNAAVNSLGVCRILSELKNDLVAVHPIGVCPPELRSPERPRGAYEVRSLDAEKAGSAAFDMIMRAAQGRMP